MKLEEYYDKSKQKLLLNNMFIKRAIWNIIKYNFYYINSKKIKLKDIIISDNNYLTKYKNHWIVRYDRHCHYTNPDDFIAAAYQYLSAIGRILSYNRSKWETIIKS